MACYFLKSSLTSKMGNAWEKRLFCITISSFSLLYSWCVCLVLGLLGSTQTLITLHFMTLHYIIYAPFFRLLFVCPGLAWKYPNINYITFYDATLHYIRPFFSTFIYIYSGVIRFFSCACVRACVCDGCGRGRNEFAGRVQNYRVRSSCHRNFLEIVKAAAGQDTQSCRLREGCHCGRLPSH